MHLPTDSSDAFFRSLLNRPLLSRAEEATLVQRWQDHRDLAARNDLVLAFMPFCASHALKKAKPHLPAWDLFAEAVTRFHQAIDRFDLDRGFRLSTYADSYVTDAIRTYTAKNNAPVSYHNANRNTLAALRAERQRIAAANTAQDAISTVTQAASNLGLPSASVEILALAPHALFTSLDAPTDTGSTLADRIGAGNPEDAILDRLDHAARSRLLRDALATLSERERDIIVARRLTDPPVELHVLGVKYGISRERVRQVAEVAFEKLSAAMTGHPRRKTAQQIRVSVRAKPSRARRSRANDDPCQPAAPAPAECPQVTMANQIDEALVPA